MENKLASVVFGDSLLDCTLDLGAYFCVRTEKALEPCSLLFFLDYVAMLQGYDVVYYLFYFLWAIIWLCCKQVGL